MINIYNPVFINISSFSFVDLIIIAIFFLSVGSFCSSIIFRLAPNSPFPLYKIRSSCPSCSKKIDIINLIPLVGFLIQKGKCKFCNSNISKFYLFTEIFFLLIGILLVYNYGISLSTIIYTIIIFCFYILFVLDYKYLYLPLYINLLIVLIGVTFNARFQLFLDETFLIFGITPISFTLYGFFFGYSSLWFINFIYKFIKKKDGIGGGDFILFGGIGSIHGPIALPLILLIGSFLGCLYFIFSKKSSNSMLPFGSFLILSSFIYFVSNLMNFSFVN